jgi:predicted deacylase
MIDAAGSKAELQREIGNYRGTARGATVMVVCGIHGNEPAGVQAAQRVFARLERGDIDVRGELVVFAGNLAGLRAGIRYQSKDLNRLWTEARIEQLRNCTHDVAGDGVVGDGVVGDGVVGDGVVGDGVVGDGVVGDGVVGDDAEDLEQRELLAAMEAAQGRARGRVYMADFHTTSAAGIPFILFGDTLQQREFVAQFPLPVLVGLEEQVDGVLSAYWTRRGCVTFTCEGGAHTASSSVDNLEAVLWCTLARAGVIDGRALIEVARAEALLHERRGDLPRAIEVVSRHAIRKDDAFRMEPGFRNIDYAPAGRLLARDANGEIRADGDGMVIMPLYQGLGSDGFFWGRPISARRMKLEGMLRKFGADRIVDFVPGVRRDPRDGTKLRIDAAYRTKTTQSAAWKSLLNMLGYRRVRSDAQGTTIERQDD